MPTPTPRIAILGNRVPSLNLPELEHFADMGSLLAAPAFDVLLLDLPAVYAGRVLRKLRTFPLIATASFTVAVIRTAGVKPWGMVGALSIPAK